MAINNKLKAYVRYDGSGRVIPGSLILNRFKPKVGNWKEINANECCNETPLPANCIEFVADTTLGGLSFGMTVEVSADITYTATWGDGNTSEGTITTGISVDIEHLYTAENTAHTVTLCFSDATKVTYISFWGTD